MGMEERLKFAFDELRKVIWEKNCKEKVYPLVAEKYNLSVDEATKVTDAAFQKWEDAYYPE
jgi:hypothetical protein